MNKQTLIQKIKSISDLTHEEQAELINLVNNTKKYGLVWEDKFEQIEEDLLTNLPVLTEFKDRFIEAKPMAKPQAEEDLFTDSDEAAVEVAEAPNHIIIEGDNLHALTALSFTHKGVIDVIFIDPPYNTGGKDFKYNDTYIDREDSFRHSKWISFMAKRLRIAQSLMKENGVIFISIDDNEQAQLKLLCDEIFHEENFIAQIVWQKRTSPDSRRILGPAHDNIYCYGKSKASYECLNHLGLTEEQEANFKNPDNDPNGPWVSSDFTAQGFRPNQMYSIKTPGGVIYNPPSGRCWKNVESVFKQQLKAGRMWFGIDGKGMPRKKTYLNERKGSVPWTWWDHKTSGNNQEAKKEIIEILGNSTAFSTPKPLKLLCKSLSIAGMQDAKVLDFFAGSGSTLHATMQLNAEDGGNRQCILVTNNENNICEEVTYERNKRVIQGYTNAKGVEVAGMTNNNLRYYKCDYVPSAKTEANRRRLTEASTDLLCIKEDCYNDITKERGLNPKLCRLYTNKSGKYLAIVYHSRSQHEVNEQMCEVIAQLSDLQGKVKLYGFSPEIEVLLEDFYSVKDRVHAVPLPDAIYNAYRSTFKSINLGKRKSSDNSEQESQAEETDLFNQATTEA